MKNRIPQSADYGFFRLRKRQGLEIVGNNSFQTGKRNSKNRTSTEKAVDESLPVRELSSEDESVKKRVNEREQNLHEQFKNQSKQKSQNRDAR